MADARGGLLRGETGPPVLHESTRRVAAALPEARVATLRGQHHMALTTAPEAVADVVVSFLAAR